MAIWTAIHGFADGEYVEQSVLNRPISELKERTDYLYTRLFNLIGGSPFESVRYVDIPVETEGDLAPLTKEFVSLNPETHKLERAVARIGLFNNSFGAADASSLSIGILVSVSSDGKLGTVVSYGKIAGADEIGNWNAVDLLEEGETFRNGPYYLSSVNPGKLTANPSGPAIYIGQIYNQSANPLLIDYLVLAPQYKDIAESHIHRAIPLYSQPAGYHFYVSDTLTGYHSIFGFNPAEFADAYDGVHDGGMGASALSDSTASFTINNLIGLTLTNVTQATSAVITANTATTITATGVTWNTGDQYKIAIRCRLSIRGYFNDTASTQYTFILAGASISDPPTSGVSGFDDVWLHWTSTDPNEATGAVQVRSYETQLTIGTKGIIAILENALDAYQDIVEECTANRRTWVLQFPEQVRGWLAHKSYGYYSSASVTTEQGFSYITFGGPFNAGDSRLDDQLTIKAMHLYRLIYGTTNATDGTTITIAGTVYEFDDDSSVGVGNILVPIATAPDETFANLIDAIIEEGIDTVDCANNTDDHHVLIGVADAATVSTTLPGPITLTEIVIAGPWAIDATNALLIYDKNHKALVATTSYWNNASYWTPIALKNGISVMPIPYGIDGTAAIGNVLNNKDTWRYSLIDEAPGTKFVYNVGMHSSLSQIYPPIPFNEASLVLNGVELDSYDIFPANYSYRLGLTGIYWVYNKYGYVPWPATWVSYLATVPTENMQNAVFHNVRMAVGNTSLVTSLRPAPDSPIKIYKCGTGDSATVGDLMLDVDLQLSELDTNMEGFSVFKGIRNNSLLKGPIVSEVVAGPGIIVSSPAGVPQGRGKVMVSLSSGAGMGGDFSEIMLENAKQEMLGMFSYIRLLGWRSGQSNNINTGFTAQFKVPTVIQGNYRVVVYLTMFGEEDIPMPVGVTPSLKYAGIEFSYSILHDYLNPSGSNPYDNLIDGLITPVAPIRVEVPIGSLTGDPSYIYKAYDPIIVHNNPSEPVEQPRRILNALGNPFPTTTDIQGGVQIDPSNAYVTSGSLVAIRVKRTGITVPANEYTSNLGYINLYYKLV